MKTPRRTVTFQSILCPVDFSNHSRNAVRYAAALAQRSGGRLVVLFVNDPLLLAAAAAVFHHRRLFVERTRNELVRFVRQSLQIGPASRKDIACVVSEGNPGDEILRAVRRLGSDLIVIGTQGLSGFRKVFFGSTTEQVLGRVPIPVLAIPPSKSARHPTADPLAIRRVVAPIDLAGEWQSDVIRAAKIAAGLGAELVLVHVLAEVQTPPWLRSTVGRADGRRTEAARKALDRVRATLGPGIETTSLVREGNPAHEIARLTVGSPTLVVMSLRGGAGVWGARRGSIAYHVLRHSSTPVLTLPRRRLGGRFTARLSKAVGHALRERDRIEMAGIDALLSTALARRRARP